MYCTLPVWRGKVANQNRSGKGSKVDIGFTAERLQLQAETQVLRNRRLRIKPWYSRSVLNTFILLLLFFNP